MSKKVVIIMGSKGDLDWAKRIAETLDQFGIASVLRVASAHKSPLKCYDLIKEYEKERVVFVTVAGKSNALSGFVDAQTPCPVIACPPYGDRFAGLDILSSLRMPSGVCPMVVLEPEQAALAAAKILSVSDDHLRQKIEKYQQQKRREIEKDDKDLMRNG